jgi:glutathione synthase/RimK-type ligase-like ATP-grasp enzyme
MKHIAFASYDFPDNEFDANYIHEDENLLKVPLQIRGIQVSTVSWQSKTTDWTQFDAVILRSTWDYHLKFTEFQAWLTHLEQTNVTLLNGYGLLRWNMDKVYLEQMPKYGVRILPTEFYHTGDNANLSTIMAKHGWSRAVVKPTVSAGGDNTWRFTPEEAHEKQADFDTQVGQMSLMVQQYAESIADGEWSFLFFNGIYSHCVRKIPAQGDMFVHAHRGGSSHPYPNPDVKLVAQASNVVRVAQELTGELPLYARVDTVIDSDGIILMELECVEPYLFMPFGDAYTIERIADAIAQRV